MQIIKCRLQIQKNLQTEKSLWTGKNKLYAINWKARRAWNWSVSTLKIYVNTSFFYFCRPINEPWMSNIFPGKYFTMPLGPRYSFIFFFSWPAVAIWLRKSMSYLWPCSHLWTWMFASCLTGFWPFFSLSNSWAWIGPATLYLLDLGNLEEYTCLYDSLELNLRLWSPN